MQIADQLRAAKFKRSLELYEKFISFETSSLQRAVLKSLSV